MKIKVTEDHIKNGQPENCEGCAIALALKEKLSNYDVGVYLGGENNDVYFDIHNKHNDLEIENIIHKIDLDNVTTFIDTFDTSYYWDVDNKVSMHNEESKYTVEPFEFDVEFKFDVEIEGLNG